MERGEYTLGDGAARTPQFMEAINLLYRQRELIRNFVVRDLSSRYKGSLMGIYWNFINPLAFMAIYTLVFGVFLRVRFREGGNIMNFVLYLLCGLASWRAFSDSVGRAAGSVVTHSNLVKKTVFPSEILPVYMTISGHISGLITFGILYVLAFAVVGKISIFIFLIPLLIVLQMMFAIGLSWFFAPMHVYFRDIVQVLTLALMAWMFLTPIFYPASMIPAKMSLMLTLNPMYWIIEAYRSIIVECVAPDPKGVLYFAGVALVFFFAGYRFYKKRDKTFNEML